MIAIEPDHLLFIEPRLAPSAPIVDDITRKLTAAWRVRRTGLNISKGVHHCTALDGATSDNRDHRVQGYLSHSLAIHYVACHRAEVPQATLDLISAWTIDGSDPTESETMGNVQGGTPGAAEAIERQVAAESVVPASGQMSFSDRMICGVTWADAHFGPDSSGWCSDMESAIQRLQAWCRGDVVSSAPDGACSQAEMDALHQFAISTDHPILGAVVAAQESGQGSDQWLAVSAACAIDYRLQMVLQPVPPSPRIRRGGF